MRRRTIIFLVVCGILLIPRIDMQFTTEVNWGTGDFAVAAILLFVAGFGIDRVFGKVRVQKRRILFSALILTLLLMVWIELAVGIFGTPLVGS